MPEVIIVSFHHLLSGDAEMHFDRFLSKSAVWQSQLLVLQSMILKMMSSETELFWKAPMMSWK